MAKLASGSPYPYCNQNEPNIHEGLITVTGSQLIDLGIRRDDYDVMLSSTNPRAILAYTKGSTPVGRFTIAVTERAADSMIGGLVIPPTTPSVQDAAGGDNHTHWRVDVQAYIAEVGGVAFAQAAQADLLLCDGVLAAGALHVGDSVVCSIYLRNRAGTVTQQILMGTPAVTGLEVAPTDAQITAACAAGDIWMRIADCTINRTGDAVVTQSENNLVRFTAKTSQNAVPVRFVALVS